MWNEQAYMRELPVVIEVNENSDTISSAGGAGGADGGGVDGAGRISGSGVQGIDGVAGNETGGADDGAGKESEDNCESLKLSITTFCFKLFTIGSFCG